MGREEVGKAGKGEKRKGREAEKQERSGKGEKGKKVLDRLAQANYTMYRLVDANRSF